MAIETKANLTEETTKALQTLTRYNIDAAKGFDEAASCVKSPALEGMFREMADERKAFAETLQNYVEFNGEEPVDSGSMLAAAHRTLLDLRSLLNAGNPHPILCEVKRGETAIKSAYENVLQDTAGSAMNDILLDQFEAIKKRYDAIDRAITDAKLMM